MNSDLDKLYDLKRRFTEPFAGLTGGESRLYAIFGGPSAGKTRLLQHLEETLKKQADPIAVPVFIDCNLAALGSLDSVNEGLTWLLEELRQCLKNEPYRLCALLDDLFKRFSRSEYDPIGTFNDAFGFMRNTARKHIGQGLREVQLIALIDNADKLADLAIAPDLFNSLHALLRETDVKGFLKLVLAGSDSLYDRLHQPNGVWRTDAVTTKLAAFEPEVAQTYLSDKSGAQMPAHIALLIYAFSGGHPGLLNALLDELLVEITADEWDEVTSDMVIDAVEEIAGRVNIWHTIGLDEAQIEHDVYRLLAGNRPSPETLAARLKDQPLQGVSERLRTLLLAFSDPDQNGADLGALASLIDAVLDEMDIPLEAGIDWAGRLSTLRNELPALYNLWADSAAPLRNLTFRKKLPKGSLYKPALDRLLYMGAIQALPRKHYLIQGQIFFDQFPTFSENITNISPELYEQLREALLNCEEFEEDSSLMAIFSNPRLRRWRNELPEAESDASRVMKVMNFLHNKYNDTQENALVLLLSVLSKGYHPEDARHEHLANLAAALEAEIKRL